MTLLEYTRSLGLKQAETARQIGCKQAAVSHYVRGRRMPEWPAMLRIARWSNGAVTPNDFLPAKDRAAIGL